MSDADDMLTLADLAQQSDVSQRTIRYYIQFGLLPAPEGAGPKARYGRGHLGRLRLIRMLQDRHLPLNAIRKVLAQRTETELERIGETSGSQSRSSALGYVMSLLESTPKQGGLFDRSVQRLEAEGAEPPAESRSHWERIRLTADIELHVRRPLSKPDNRRLEELLRHFRQLFTEENIR